MKLPSLNQRDTYRETIDVFAGYNHNLRISDGEFFDMKNLTSTNYPVFSPRNKRGVYKQLISNPVGLIAKDSLGYIEGGEFHLGEYSTSGLNLSESAVVGKTTLTSMGAYVIIITRNANNSILDKKWVNTADPQNLTYGEIDASFVTENGTEVSFEMCKVDGEVYKGAVISQTQPEEPSDKDLWIDTSETPHALKQYSGSNATWTAIATTYIKITAPGIGIQFSQYDGVTISGITNSSLFDLNNTMIIWDKGDDYIVVIGVLDEAVSQTDPITIKREMPLMDYVIESENRLWGCRYGQALNGEMVNEIYVSKQGDFKNWNTYLGVATDSYTATVGTDGPFTGAIAHLGYPLFFKENCMHKIYGNYPANYQIQTITCRGVQNGSAQSLAIVNETLYYKSRKSICAYDGSLPTEMSYPLGDISYSDAVACAYGNKYYASMKDSAGEYHLFVYDTSKGMWHKEDNTRVNTFCSCGGELYYIDNNEKNKIKTVNGTGELETEPVTWMAETGFIGTDSPDKKYISRLNIRLSLDIGTRIHVYIQYDSIGSWEKIFSISGHNLRSFTVPIRPKRCDHLKLRIEGIGDVKIYSITKTIEEGSDF